MSFDDTTDQSSLLENGTALNVLISHLQNENITIEIASMKLTITDF